MKKNLSRRIMADRADCFSAPIFHSLPAEAMEELRSNRATIARYIQNPVTEAEDMVVVEITDRAFEELGIYAGDLVMASTRAIPAPGDLVVVTVGNERFVAIYHPGRDRIRLDRDASGQRFTIVDPMLPDVVLHGKVIHLFRKIE